VTTQPTNIGYFLEEVETQMGTIHITIGKNERLVVQFRYSPERVATVKRIPGREWHPIMRVWTVPFSLKVIEQLQNLFLGDRVVVSESVRVASPELASDHVKIVLAALDEELTLRGYSPNTRDNYRLHMLRFLRWLRKDPTFAEEGDLRAYLVEMLDSGLSASYVRQAKAALIVYHCAETIAKISRTFLVPKDPDWTDNHSCRFVSYWDCDGSLIRAKRYYIN
jgi:hypothetical protein